MKRVLIAVVSARQHPYGAMINTSMETWDAEPLDGTETFYYCAKFANQHKSVPIAKHEERVLYFDVPEAYLQMGHKNLLFFRWALANRDWVYMARVNASCYVHKRRLLEYCQSLPLEDVFRGVGVMEANPVWLWGGGQFLISRDVVQKIVDNSGRWNHMEIEDMAMSHLAREIGIEVNPEGWSCTIDKTESGWRCISYGIGDSFTFEDFKDMNRAGLLNGLTLEQCGRSHGGQFFFRVKHDPDRSVDRYVMQQLKEHLSP